MCKKTVYIIDDEPLSLGLVKALADSAGLVSKAFSSPIDFIDFHDASHDGCIVLDLHMPEMSGLELQQEMNKRGCTLPIIFIAGCGDIASAVKAMKAGAIDFLEKPYDGKALLSSIADAFHNKKENANLSLRNESMAERVLTLTPREHEVMKLLASSMSNKDIARELNISHRTVEVHRQHIMRKLKIKSVVELTKLAE